MSDFAHLCQVFEVLLGVEHDAFAFEGACEYAPCGFEEHFFFGGEGDGMDAVHADGSSDGPILDDGYGEAGADVDIGVVVGELNLLVIEAREAECAFIFEDAGGDAGADGEGTDIKLGGICDDAGHFEVFAFDIEPEQGAAMGIKSIFDAGHEDLFVLIDRSE